VQQQKATLEVVNGEHPGSVKFIAKAEAATYIWQYILVTALTADGVWQVTSITTGGNATLDGLTRVASIILEWLTLPLQALLSFVSPFYLSAYLPGLNIISTESRFMTKNVVVWNLTLLMLKVYIKANRPVFVNETFL
jgi:hypothetical protein